MINSTEDIKNFINDKNFKKIFVLCGKKSFITSRAEIFFKKLLDNKDVKLFYKISEYNKKNFIHMDEMVDDYCSATGYDFNDLNPVLPHEWAEKKTKKLVDTMNHLIM